MSIIIRNKDEDRQSIMAAVSSRANMVQDKPQWNGRIFRKPDHFTLETTAEFPNAQKNITVRFELKTATIGHQGAFFGNSRMELSSLPTVIAGANHDSWHGLQRTATEAWCMLCVSHPSWCAIPAESQISALLAPSEEKYFSKYLTAAWAADAKYQTSMKAQPPQALPLKQP